MFSYRRKEDIFYCIGKIEDFTYTTKHIPHKIALQFYKKK